MLVGLKLSEKLNPSSLKLKILLKNFQISSYSIALNQKIFHKKIMAMSDVDKISKNNLLENGVKENELSSYKKPSKEVAARKSAKFGRS